MLTLRAEVVILISTRAMSTQGKLSVFRAALLNIPSKKLDYLSGNFSYKVEAEELLANSFYDASFPYYEN